MFLQYCSIKRNQPPNIFSLHRKKYFIISSETSPKFGKFEVLQFYVIYSGDKTWLDEKKKWNIRDLAPRLYAITSGSLYYLSFPKPKPEPA